MMPFSFQERALPRPATSCRRPLGTMGDHRTGWWNPRTLGLKRSPSALLCFDWPLRACEWKAGVTSHAACGLDVNREVFLIVNDTLRWSPMARKWSINVDSSGSFCLETTSMPTMTRQQQRETHHPASSPPRPPPRSPPPKTAPHVPLLLMLGKPMPHLPAAVHASALAHSRMHSNSGAIETSRTKFFSMMQPCRLCRCRTAFR